MNAIAAQYALKELPSVPCLSPEAVPPRVLAALAAVGLVLANRFPGVAVPSLRRVVSAHEATRRLPRKPKSGKQK
jgi:hypothetical protein